MAFYFTPDQEWALAQFGPVSGHRILDVGAGLGVNAIYLAGKGATVLAVDIAQERLCALRSAAVQISEASAGRIWLVRCAAEALPFREEAFDNQYSKSVLIHTRLTETCAELARTLRAGGTSVFIEPLTRNPFVIAYRRTLAPREWRLITHYFTREDVRLLQSSFPGGETRYYYFFAFFAFGWQFGLRWPSAFRVSLWLLNRLDEILFAVLPFLRRFAWFSAICVRK
jgi:ubiquinone/menaquinone biosynthesis C-methylase UbiE